jgi:hypothetical protein
MKPAGDHQVEDEPKIVFQPNSDALADATQLEHLLAFHAADGRLRCPQKREPVNLHACEALAEKPFFQRLKVDRDVGQLRHRRLRSL